MTVDNEKLDELFGAAVDMAVFLLEQNGEFFPIGAVVDQDGAVSYVAIESEEDQPESKAVIQELTKLFTERAAEGSILASVIAFDARVRPYPDAAPVDAIVSRIRAPGYARDVITPYSITTSGLFRKKRKVETGPASASEGQQDIFT